MDLINQKELIVLAVAFFSTYLATYGVRFLAQKVGFVSIPSATRWNQKSVALGGGIGLFIGFSTVFFFLDLESLALFFLPALALFAVGLYDDINGIKPVTKLIFQILVAGYAVSQFQLLPLPWIAVAIPITMVWIVGMTNSVNMLDNMDGLTSGIIAIAGIGFFLVLKTGDKPTDMSFIALATTGATLGFLIHNFNPARIFMGDAGSLFLGYVVALLATDLRLTSLPDGYALLLTAMILFVPLFDTVLVIIARWNAHRAFMAGGRDHSSHRLVSLGLTERKAVLLLYAIGLSGIFTAYYVSLRDNYTILMLASIMAVVAGALFGIFLLEVKVYHKEKPQQRKATKKPRKRLLKHVDDELPEPILFVLEIGLDVCVIALAWTLAHYVKFESLETSGYLESSIVPRLPQIIVLKIVCFFIFRLYRGFWRTISVNDVAKVFKAVTLASVVYLAASALKTRMFDLSRMVIVLDWAFTFVLVLGVRAGFSLFRRWSTRLASKPYQVAFVVPSKVQELFAASIENERGLEFKGVILSDQGQGKRQGTLGGIDDLGQVLKDNNIEILFVPPGMEKKLKSHSNRGVTIRPMKIDIGY